MGMIPLYTHQGYILINISPAIDIITGNIVMGIMKAGNKYSISLTIDRESSP